MIPILTAIVLMVAVGTVLQDAGGFARLFGGSDTGTEAEAPATQQPIPSIVSLRDERVRVAVGMLVRLNVLDNDLGIGQVQRKGLSILRTPSCGRIFVQDGVFQFLAETACPAPQQITYTVPGAAAGVTGTITVIVEGGSTEAAAERVAEADPEESSRIAAAPQNANPASDATLPPAGDSLTQARPAAPQPEALQSTDAPERAQVAEIPQPAPSAPEIKVQTLPTVDIAPPAEIALAPALDDSPLDLGQGGLPGAAKSPPTSPSPTASSQSLGAPQLQAETPVAALPTVPTSGASPLGADPVIASNDPGFAAGPGTAPSVISPAVSGAGVGDVVSAGPTRDVAPIAGSAGGALQRFPVPSVDSAPEVSAPDRVRRASAPEVVVTSSAPEVGAAPAWQVGTAPSPTAVTGGRLAGAPLGGAPEASTERAVGHVPAPDPVLALHEREFQQAPSGTRLSGSPREWRGAPPVSGVARNGWLAASATDRRLGPSIELAHAGAGVADPGVMVVVVERREPTTQSPEELVPLDASGVGDASLDLARPDVLEVQRASLPESDLALAAAVLGAAALGQEPIDRAQAPYVTPVAEADHPLPAPAPRIKEVPAGETVASLPQPTIDCVVPPSLTLDVRRAGRTIVSVASPCHAGQVAELAYSGLRLAMTLDGEGRGQVLALGFEPNAPAVLDLTSGEPIDFDLPFKGMNRVSRIALVWDQPVDIELNALEFGALLGSPNHVSALNPRGFEDVRRAGGGFLTRYRAAYGKGQNAEVYTFYQRRGGPIGVVQLLVDYVSRSRDRLQGTCGEGIYATPQYQVIRSVRGMRDREIKRRLAPMGCSDVVVGIGDKRLIPGAVGDLLVTRD